MYCFNPLNAELNPMCHLLALLGAHHILHVRRIRVKHVLWFTSSHTHTHQLKQVPAPLFSAETFTSHEVFSCRDLISVKLAVTIMSCNQREIT
jgi:hypothetical protein